MTTPENPERMMAVALRLSPTGRPEMSASTVPLDWWQKEHRGRISRYVREDVAEAAVAAAEAKYKNRDVEVMRVALADLRRIRSCLVNRAAGLRRIGEEARAMGVEDAIKQLDEEVFT